MLKYAVGMPLLIRTNHGIDLTKAGKSFVKDATFMVQFFEEALLRMRQFAQANQLVIRVGTSMLNPYKVLLDMWNEVSNKFPQFKINIVHFEDDSHTLPTTYRTIGKNYDFIVGPILTENLKEYFQVLELGSNRFCFALSRNHRLASKKTISVKDLYGEELAVVNGGGSAVIDEIRNFMIKNHPKIRIKDIPRLYDIDIFNRCEESGVVLLTLDVWADIHPSLVTIPSDLDFAIPYGLLYPLHPSEDANQFLEIIKKIQFQQS
ncbi:LysR family transcriptional regulator [Paenibacillus anseongense]|uniref:LysR family transcriptional regulator n=1 Tax=Paenibacillus anseongense TaxID=2682845 RepID=UPI001C882874|nr:LysR family transcriptional regulator [Paenibacillus anseongense]